MWKKEDAVNPETAGSHSRQAVDAGTTARPDDPAPGTAGAIGKSILVNGELRGKEDLRVDGSVVGTVELRDNVLTVGPTGAVEAQIFARHVIVLGSVHGGITASEKVEIREGGSLEGTVVAPRVAIADGAHFRGKVDMQRGQPAPTAADQSRKIAEPARPAVPVGS